MADADHDRRVGTVLCGKWTLERLLGTGGAAAVYQAVHKIGRREAVKILHPEIARVPELRARFEQEAHTVNRFVHPGAVEIRDVDTTEDGCPFLVMELLEGETLAARAAKQALGMDEVLRLTDELLDVLAAAHEKGIIHRDIKPDNLFCTRDGHLKVLDFGVARVRHAAARDVRTRTGTMIGTVAYMPPEQVKGEPIDERADIFAVGATVFRLVAGRHVHEARSEAELMVKMMSEPAPPLASVAPHAPAGLCAIVDRALTFDRERRYPSAAAMQADVRALSALGVSGAAARPAPMAERTLLTRWTVTTVRGRRLRWAALAFPLVGAGVLAAVYYWAIRPRPARAPASQSASPRSQPVAAPAPPAAVAPAATPGPAAAPAPRHRRKIRSESLLPRASCVWTGNCDHTCEDACTIACGAGERCSVGALANVRVTCAGSTPCDIACAGPCTADCMAAPCRATCSPGAECEIEACPQPVEACGSDALACAMPCPPAP